MIKISLYIGTPDMPDIELLHLSKDEIENSVKKAAEYGFDGVELIIGDPDTFDSQRLKKALCDSEIELACINTGRMILQYGLSLLHHDDKTRKRAFNKLKSIVDIAGIFSCPVTIGLFRGGAIEGKPISYTEDMFEEIMKEACEYAIEFDVDLILEPHNRFESNFINTTDEGLEMVKRVDHPNFGLLLDLYHMYIEDLSIEESIVNVRDYVKHFHFSDSDRWPVGVSKGVIDFKGIIDILKLIDFNGFLSEGLVKTDNVDEYAVKTVVYLKELIR